MPMVNGAETLRRAKRLSIAERRQRVSELAKAGKTDTEIALELALSVSVVKSDLRNVRKQLTEATQANIAVLRERKVRDHEDVIAKALEAFMDDPKPGWLTVVTQNHIQIAKLQGLNAPVEQNVNVMPLELSQWKVEAAQRMALTMAGELEFYEEDEIIEGEAKRLTDGRETAA